MYFLWLSISFQTIKSPFFCGSKENIVLIFISHDFSPNVIIIGKDSQALLTSFTSPNNWSSLGFRFTNLIPGYQRNPFSFPKPYIWSPEETSIDFIKILLGSFVSWLLVEQLFTTCIRLRRFGTSSF